VYEHEYRKFIENNNTEMSNKVLSKSIKKEIYEDKVTKIFAKEITDLIIKLIK